MPVKSRKRRYTSSSEDENSEPETAPKTSTAPKKSKADRLKEARERAKAAMDRRKSGPPDPTPAKTAAKTPKAKAPKEKPKRATQPRKKTKVVKEEEQEEYGPAGTPVRARGPTGTPVRDEEKQSVSDVFAEAEEAEALLKKKKMSKAEKRQLAREKARISMGGGRPSVGGRASIGTTTTTKTPKRLSEVPPPKKEDTEEEDKKSRRNTIGSGVTTRTPRKSMRQRKPNNRYEDSEDENYGRGHRRTLKKEESSEDEKVTKRGARRTVPKQEIREESSEEEEMEEASKQSYHSSDDEEDKDSKNNEEEDHSKQSYHSSDDDDDEMDETKPPAVKTPTKPKFKYSPPTEPSSFSFPPIPTTYDSTIPAAPPNTPAQPASKPKNNVPSTISPAAVIEEEDQDHENVERIAKRVAEVTADKVNQVIQQNLSPGERKTKKEIEIERQSKMARQQLEEERRQQQLEMERQQEMQRLEMERQQEMQRLELQRQQEMQRQQQLELQRQQEMQRQRQQEMQRQQELKRQQEIQRQQELARQQHEMQRKQELQRYQQNELEGGTRHKHQQREEEWQRQQQQQQMEMQLNAHQQQQIHRPTATFPTPSPRTTPKEEFKFDPPQPPATKPEEYSPYVPPKHEKYNPKYEEEDYDETDYDRNGFLTETLHSLRASSDSIVTYIMTLIVLGLSTYIFFASLELWFFHPNSPVHDLNIPNLTMPLIPGGASNECKTETGGVCMTTNNKGMTQQPKDAHPNAPPCYLDTATSSSYYDEDEWWFSYRNEMVPSSLQSLNIDSCITYYDESGDKIPTPCPKHGRCFGGYLRDCLSSDVSDDGPTTIITNFDSVGTLSVEAVFTKTKYHDGCVVSEKITTLKDLVEESVVDLTLEMHCSIWGRCASLPGSDVVLSVSLEDEELEGPWFTLKGLVGYMNDKVNAEGQEEEEMTADGEEEQDDKETYSVEFLKGILFLLDDNMIQVLEQPLSEGESTSTPALLLGLTSDYIHQQMNVPIGCWTRLLCMSILRLVFGFVYSLVGYMCGFIFRSSVNYPLPTFLSLGLIYVVSWIRNKRRETRETRDLVFRIREMAYERLMECRRGSIGGGGVDSPAGRGVDGYAVLFLRDEIGHELYPCSMKERKKFFVRVWPKVVAEVRYDNRVRKVQRVVEGGKKLDHWEWIAPVTGYKNRRGAGVSMDEMNVVDVGGGRVLDYGRRYQ
uniref:Uncharacterized protein n=1 Tax=Ditylum brightwellii TaxID=49249 RepID=A0A6V2JAP1_9STRA